MKQNLYSIYDKTAKAYINVLEAENDSDAVRVLTAIVNNGNKQNNLHLFPEQFSIWKIGTLDKTDGKLEADRQELMSGNACVTEEKYTLIEAIEELKKELNK